MFEMTSYNEGREDESYKQLGRNLRVMRTKKELFLVKIPDEESSSRKSHNLFPSPIHFSDSDESQSPPPKTESD